MAMYREVAMRHGDRWLIRKKVGVMQELRKGKGDASELEAKLSILLQVMGQREMLAGKMRKEIEGLEGKQKLLAEKKRAIDKEIAESEPMRRKKEVELQLDGIHRKINDVAEAANMLIGIKRNGLAETRHMRDFWEKLLP